MGNCQNSKIKKFEKQTRKSQETEYTITVIPSPEIKCQSLDNYNNFEEIPKISEPNETILKSQEGFREKSQSCKNSDSEIRRKKILQSINYRKTGSRKFPHEIHSISCKSKFIAYNQKNRQELENDISEKTYKTSKTQKSQKKVQFNTL